MHEGLIEPPKTFVTSKNEKKKQKRKTKEGNHHKQPRGAKPVGPRGDPEITKLGLVTGLAGTAGCLPSCLTLAAWPWRPGCVAVWMSVLLPGNLALAAWLALPGWRCLAGPGCLVGSGCLVYYLVTWLVVCWLVVWLFGWLLVGFWLFICWVLFCLFGICF